MQQFECKTRLIYGPDALQALTGVSAASVMLVTDRFFLDNKTAARVTSLLPGCRTEIFGEVLPDPEVSQVAEATAQLNRAQATIVLALGGGSVLDCAKAMAFFALRRPMLIAIPTTSGTGSEVTAFSILTHNGVKHPLVDEALRPDWAIIDDSLAAMQPPRLIAQTGMDLVSHALEAITAAGASPMTDAFAHHALSAALRLLPRSYAGDAAVRGELHLAATMAGLSFDRAGLGLCHALSHALGGRFHLPHGRLNAVLLPAVMQFNAPCALIAYARAARACGVACSHDQMAYRGLLQQVKALRRALELPQTLSQAGIAPAALEASIGALCEAALHDSCLAGNPIAPTAAQLEALLRSVAQ